MTASPKSPTISILERIRATISKGFCDEIDIEAIRKRKNMLSSIVGKQSPATLIQSGGVKFNEEGQLTAVTPTDTSSAWEDIYEMAAKIENAIAHRMQLILTYYDIADVNSNKHRLQNSLLFATSLTGLVNHTSLLEKRIEECRVKTAGRTGPVIMHLDFNLYLGLYMELTTLSTDYENLVEPLYVTVANTIIALAEEIDKENEYANTASTTTPTIA